MKELESLKKKITMIYQQAILCTDRDEKEKLLQEYQELSRRYRKQKEWVNAMQV